MQNLSEITSTQYTGGVDSSNYKDGLGFKHGKMVLFLKVILHMTMQMDGVFLFYQMGINIKVNF